MTTIAGGNTTGLYDATASTIQISSDINANSIYTNNLTVGNSATIGNTLTVSNTITGGNVTTVGNVTAGNVLTDNYYYANGAPFVTSDYGNANVAAYLPTNTANVGAGNIAVSGEISAAGNITGSFLFGNGSQLTGISGTYSNADVQAYLPTYTGDLFPGHITATGNIVAAGNVGGTYLLGDGQFITNLPGGSYGNSNVANYLPVYSGAITSISELSATGNITGGNIATGGALDVTGNITTGGILTDGYYYANGAPFVSSDYGNANVATYLPTYTGNLASMEGIITTLANITGGNILSSGLVSAAGTIVTTGNVEGGNADITNAVTAATITTTGNVLIGGNLTVNGNTTQVNIENLNVQDPIIGLGRGADNAPLTTNDGKDRGEQLWYYTTEEKSAFVGYDNSAGNIIAATDVSITDEIVTVNVYGTFETGNIQAESLSATGNVDGYIMNVVSDVYAGAFIGGELDLTGNAVVAGDVNAGTFTGSGSGLTGLARGNDSTIQYNVGGDGGDTAGNDNLTWNEGTNTLAVVGTFDLTGDMLMGPGNIDVTGLITASGNITGGNIDTTGIIVAGAGATITGTLDLTGDMLMGPGNIDLTGNISASGNIDAFIMNVTSDIYAGAFIGGELDLTGNAVVAGEVNAGTFTGSGSGLTGLARGNDKTVQYNVGGDGGDTAGNDNFTWDESTNTLAVVGTFDLTGDMLMGPGNIDLTGNLVVSDLIQGQTIVSTGAISATGNITGDYFIGNGSLLTGIAASGTGNSISNGTSEILISESGGNANITIGGTSNVVVVATTGAAVTGTMSATGNITGGNIITAGIITATGGIASAGNVSGANIVTGLGVTGKWFAETVYAFGNATGNITGNVDINNGAVQTMTLTGNITINSVANAEAGQSFTLIMLQDTTGNRTLTSDWKFAGNTRTLSTAANAIDVISVVYSGNDYYASLTKGYV